jgi:filamentous hemagglutinin family protein
VGVGDRVYFNPATGINNILSRVTGANASNILGTLGVNGSANLFLINPRGIVFGKDAKLDIAGSFVGSTADRWMLGDGTAYQVTNPNAPPLLTVDVSPGLQYGATATAVQRPGNITNFGKLRVGGSFQLAANQIEFQGGVASAEKNIILYASTIVLANQSFVESIVSANATEKGGDIAIQTQSLSVKDGSEIATSTFSAQGFKAGDIYVLPIDPKQTSTVTLSGYAPFKGLTPNGSSDGGYSSGLFVATEDLPGGTAKATGNGGTLFIQGITNLNLENGAVISGRSRSAGGGGNIFIDVTNLSITGGAQITVPSYKTGTPGNMVINAETINISGSDATWSDRFDAVKQAYINAGKSRREALEQAKFTIDPFSSSSGLQSSLLLGNGVRTKNGGIILVNASKSLSLTNGGEISSSTFGKGNGGFISISTGKSYPSVRAFFDQVLNTYESSDFDTKLSLGGNSGLLNLDLSSSVRSSVNSGAEGDAGTIHISTGKLKLDRGSQIQTLVFRPSDTEVGGKGDAGSVWVKADDSVVLINRSAEFGSAILSSIERGATGEKSGVIAIKTPLLYINNGAFINTSNFSGGGSAGYILAATDFIVLDRTSRIVAASLSGKGGNVGLQSRYLLGVSRGSRISTAAGSSTASGDGGNLAIGSDLTLDANSNVVLNSDRQTLLTYGFPYKNSDIVANAFGGSGGRIDLSTLALRNLAKRSDTIISDDLDASSDVGFNGIVNVNTFNLDVDRGLQPMNDRFRDYALSEGCDPRTRQEANSLKQIGTGTLAQDSTQQLERRTTIAAIPIPTTNPNTPRAENGVPIAAIPAQLIPAQGWTKAPDGKLQFIAANSAYSGVINSNLCPVERS